MDFPYPPQNLMLYMMAAPSAPRLEHVVESLAGEPELAGDSNHGQGVNR